MMSPDKAHESPIKQLLLWLQLSVTLGAVWCCLEEALEASSAAHEQELGWIKGGGTEPR